MIGAGVPVAAFALILSASASNGPPTVRSHGLRSANQLVAVVVAADFCASTRNASVRNDVRTTLQSLASQAAGAGKQFVTIGVSVDPSAVTGARFLNDLFEFDEITAGNNWTGRGALRYLWQDFPGAPRIPQILIFHRELVVDTAGGLSVRTANERVLKRLIGSDAITAFARRPEGIELEELVIVDLRPN